jgi:diguanylate cyclase (GGDEF)-like protein
MMCDMDNFKRVNDTYGHQAGDEAIQTLASVLKSACRPGDLVARYGGEEFVMLYADCDNATAARRAEQARKALSQAPQPRLGGRCVTASFGVTEVQPGDTEETMLRRADRALLMAKAKGRNLVVQLGAGAEPPDLHPSAASDPASDAESPFLVEQRLITPVPLWMAVEKLRGFMADHRAKVLKVEGNHVQLLVGYDVSKRMRRTSDHPTTFRVDVKLDEEPIAKRAEKKASQGAWVRTRLFVTIALERSRERRREELVHRAKEVLVSFRSYLMANQEDTPNPDAALAPGDPPISVDF